MREAQGSPKAVRFRVTVAAFLVGAVVCMAYALWPRGRVEIGVISLPDGVQCSVEEVPHQVELGVDGLSAVLSWAWRPEQEHARVVLSRGIEKHRGLVILDKPSFKSGWVAGVADVHSQDGAGWYCKGWATIGAVLPAPGCWVMSYSRNLVTGTDGERTIWFNDALVGEEDVPLGDRTQGVIRLSAGAVDIRTTKWSLRGRVEEGVCLQLYEWDLDYERELDTKAGLAVAYMEGQLTRIGVGDPSGRVTRNFDSGARFEGDEFELECATAPEREICSLNISVVEQMTLSIRITTDR